MKWKNTEEELPPKGQTVFIIFPESDFIHVVSRMHAQTDDGDPIYRSLLDRSVLIGGTYNWIAIPELPKAEDE